MEPQDNAPESAIEADASRATSDDHLKKVINERDKAKAELRELRAFREKAEKLEAEKKLSEAERDKRYEDAVGMYRAQLDEMESRVQSLTLEISERDARAREQSLLTQLQTKLNLDADTVRMHYLYARHENLIGDFDEIDVRTVDAVAGALVKRFPQLTNKAGRPLATPASAPTMSVGEALAKKRNARRFI